MSFQGYDLNLYSNQVRSDRPIEAWGYDLVFRLLTPGELLEVWDIASRHASLESQTLRVKIECLARAIVLVDNQPLTLDTKEKELVKASLGKTELKSHEEASVILQDRVSIPTIKAWDQALADWMEEYIDLIEERVKKKRNPGVTGMSTSSFSPGTPPSSPPTGTSAPWVATNVSPSFSHSLMSAEDREILSKLPSSDLSPG